MGGADSDAVQGDGGNDVAADTQLFSLSGQQGRGSGVFVTEAEAVAGHQPPGPVPLSQHEDKIHPGHGHHLLVKGSDNDLFNAEQFPYRLAALLRRGEQRHRRTGNELPGRAVEGKYGRRESLFLGSLHRTTQQGLMTQMNTIKKAQGDDFSVFFVHGRTLQAAK